MASMNEEKFSYFDRLMMEEALSEARLAYCEGEVPVGAVLTYKGEILATGRNQMESYSDPTAHAEILAIRAGASEVRDWRLKGTTLYTTLEPCLMCAGALLLARVDRVVWAAPDLRHGANGSLCNVFALDHPTHSIKIEGGLLEETAANLMRTFFKWQRKENEKRPRRVVRRTY